MIQIGDSHWIWHVEQIAGILQGDEADVAWAIECRRRGFDGDEEAWNAAVRAACDRPASAS